jgi:hypothetical protein
MEKSWTESLQLKYLIYKCQKSNNIRKTEIKDKIIVLNQK